MQKSSNFIIIKIKITSPTISDGRDLLTDIINDQWSPTVLLYQIILLIPSFLVDIYMFN